MKILLLSMPDSFEHMPSVAICMPNGALTSLAGNVDEHHQVAVADLVLVQQRVRGTIEQLVNDVEPDLLGLSIMTFQRKTAGKIIHLIRSLRPQIQIVVGGYDPSLDPRPYMETSLGVDFIVSGEGEITFRDLLRAIESGGDYCSMAGLSYRTPEGFCSNRARSVSKLEAGEIHLPKRAARVLKGYSLLGHPVDVVETSRGCTFDCSFCSIVQMRGRNFFRYPQDRVLADIRDAKEYGARVIFLVDDNITLDVSRFEALCREIINSGLNDIDYVVQGMTSAIANHGETLAPLMRQAGFRYVFLGIENILDGDLEFLRARAKNLQHKAGRSGNASLKAIEYLHRHKMYVVGGLIVGTPDDTRESIEANLNFARRYIDWPYIQHPMPYPGTPMADDLRKRGLIRSENVEEYDGTTVVVKSRHLPADEIEFLRWRAERWMKLRHMPAALFQAPLFVLRHAPKMLAHTFRGSSLKSLLRFEDEQEVFKRYQAIRKGERNYL